MTLGNAWELTGQANPATTLHAQPESEELTSAADPVHRYPSTHRDARLVVDFSLGGMAIPYGATVTLRSP